MSLTESVETVDVTERMEAQTAPKNLSSHLDQMPPEVKRNLILRRKVWPRMNVWNENWMCFMAGEAGSGKTYAALRLASALDPTFSIDRVTYSVEEFLKLADSDLPEGAILVLEEAGVAAGNRDWYTIANKVLDALTQTWRHRNYGAVMTAPDFDLIDNHVQRRFHHLVVMEGKNEQAGVSKARIKYIQTNHEIGKMYKKYHRMIGDDGVLRRHKYIKFRLPDPDIVEAYELTKTDYTDDLIGDLLEQIQAEQAKNEQDDLSPMEVAKEILDEDRVGEYISEASGGEYFDRDLLKMDWNVSESQSKQIKKFLVREAGLDVM
ncbi:zonular occludens toxin domain-containing protein [Halogeometricum limi]|uniref:Zonular occludens toxin (Zot) n=1 Tax=Halogeometricum limi TaxID=555875 RepID=A0A1I6FW62_9EURY|nr:zonular occludens toxin domain-containing protein [Halogeometricum limi]SFR34205.1 Zonular occludens toxin (Zot) [Halogeometricum limi]